MTQISDILVTGSAHDSQADLAKLRAFQLFIEALLHLTREQQCELVIEEFYDDILTVLTFCIEFIKKFTHLGLADHDENDKKNSGKDVTASNPVLGCAVPPAAAATTATAAAAAAAAAAAVAATPTAVVSVPSVKSSRNKNVPGSGSKKNVPASHTKEDIPDSNQNDQKSSQEIIVELLSECLSVAALCCDIYLNSNNNKSMREKQEGDVSRRNSTDDRNVLR